MITEENSNCNRGQCAEMIKKDVRGASRAGGGNIQIKVVAPGKTRGWYMGVDEFLRSVLKSILM